ncbi:MAG TPA: cytochrome c [Chthoniobacterales bacterium]
MSPPDPARSDDEKFVEPPIPPAEGEIDLVRVHGSILREQHEPREGREGVPLWFVTLIMMLVFWCGLYLANNAGGFRADVFNPSKTLAARKPADPATLGQRVFVRNCAVCHQADGQGIMRQYPPLAGSEWVLAQEWRGDNHLVNILLHGVEGALTVRGQVYNGAMPPWKILRDEDLAAVLNYLRTSWGNSAPPISPDYVKRLREQSATRFTPWTQRELKGLPREIAPPPAKDAKLGIPSIASPAGQEH